MEFVNVHGQPINFGAGNLGKVKKPTKVAEAHHKGWRAVGFSPEQIAEAKVAHEEDSAREVHNGRQALPAWNEDAWMRHAKPKAIRSKPYELEDAAVQCAALATRNGWKRTHHVRVAKGGQ